MKDKTTFFLVLVEQLPLAPFQIVSLASQVAMLTAALFTIAKTRSQPRCPSTGEWVKKMWCVYIYTVEYQSLKRMK